MLKNVCIYPHCLVIVNLHVLQFGQKSGYVVCYADRCVGTKYYTEIEVRILRRYMWKNRLLYRYYTGRTEYCTEICALM